MLQGAVVSVNRNDVYSFTKPVWDEIVLLAGIGVEGDVHAGVRVKHRGRVRADPTQPNLRQVHLMQAELFGEVGAKGYTVAPGDLGENVTTSGIDLLALPRGTILRFGPPPLPADGTVQAEAAGVTGGAGVAAAGGVGVLEGVLAAAAATTLDEATAAATDAVAAAAGRDDGADPRPAVIVAGLRNPCAQINGFQRGLLKEMVEHDAEGNVIRKAGVMAVVLRSGPVRAGDAVVAELPPRPHARLDRV